MTKLLSLTMKRNKNIKIFFIVSVFGLLTNLVWENLQAPLYQGYNNFWQHFQICLIASLGDVAIIILLYVLFALIFRNILWFQNLNWKSILFLIIIGTIIGIGIEKWALITGRWNYTESMLVIPFLNVGLIPVLQMMLLPLLTFYVAKKLYDR